MTNLHTWREQLRKTPIAPGMDKAPYAAQDLLKVSPIVAKIAQMLFWLG